MKIVFVRHTSVNVPAGVCYGQTDVDLSANFATEAEAVKAALSGYSFAKAYTSPLTRCTRLAAYCGFTGAIRDARLMEMNFGEWEMKRYDEIADPRLQEWFADYINVAATGGESSVQQRARLHHFISDLCADNTADSVVVFTHGGILAHAAAIANGLTLQEAFSLKFPFGAIFEAEF